MGEHRTLVDLMESTLETGKYVMPAPPEERLELSPLVANVLVYGDGRPYNGVAALYQERARPAAARAG